MDILARITVPNYIYQFYADASECVQGRTAEEVMADALTAYAAMLSADVMKRHNSLQDQEENPQNHSYHGKQETGSDL